MEVCGFTAGGANVDAVLNHLHDRTLGKGEPRCCCSATGPPSRKSWPCYCVRA